MKRILIPIDGSECSFRAVEQGAALAAALETEVTLLFVIGHPEGELRSNASPLMRQTIDKERAEASVLLKAAAERFAQEVTEKVVIGGISESIIDLARTDAYDMVIMGSQGLGSPLKRFLVGSVTKQVLLRVNKPVLVVR